MWDGLKFADVNEETVAVKSIFNFKTFDCTNTLHGVSSFYDVRSTGDYVFRRNQCSGWCESFGTAQQILVNFDLVFSI